MAAREEKALVIYAPDGTPREYIPVSYLLSQFHALTEATASYYSANAADVVCTVDADAAAIDGDNLYAKPKTQQDWFKIALFTRQCRLHARGAIKTGGTDKAYLFIRVNQHLTRVHLASTYVEQVHTIHEDGSSDLYVGGHAYTDMTTAVSSDGQSLARGTTVAAIQYFRGKYKTYITPEMVKLATAFFLSEPSRRVVTFGFNMMCLRLSSMATPGFGPHFDWFKMAAGQSRLPASMARGGTNKNGTAEGDEQTAKTEAEIITTFTRAQLGRRLGRGFSVNLVDMAAVQIGDSSTTCKRTIKKILSKVLDKSDFKKHIDPTGIIYFSDSEEEEGLPAELMPTLMGLLVITVLLVIMKLDEKRRQRPKVVELASSEDDWSDTEETEEDSSSGNEAGNCADAASSTSASTLAREDERPRRWSTGLGNRS